MKYVAYTKRYKCRNCKQLLELEKVYVRVDNWKTQYKQIDLSQHIHWHCCADKVYGLLDYDGVTLIHEDPPKNDCNAS